MFIFFVKMASIFDGSENKLYKMDDKLNVKIFFIHPWTADCTFDWTAASLAY